MSEQRERPQADDEGPAVDVAAPQSPLEGSLGALSAVAFAAAVAVIGVAVVLTRRPSLAPKTSVYALALSLTGAVVVALGGRTVYRQYRDDSRTTDPPVVERRATTTVPGEDVDAALYGDGEDGPLSGYERQRSARTRLRDLVTGALERDGDGSEAADTRVEEGTWTDDRIAAGFFEFGTPLSRGERVRLRVRGVSAFALQARHVIDAVAAKLNVTDRAWTDPAERGDVAAVTEGRPGRTVGMDPVDRETTRWRAVGGLALVAVGLGAVVREPGLVLAGTVAGGLVAYGTATATPTPRLAVHRRIEDDDPDPGEDVRVTVTVENAGETLLSDLRLIDGVPAGLTVAEGTPRHGTALRPGATATFTYAVEAARGTHEFDPLGVLARDASGAVERTATVAVGGDTTFTCAPKPTRELSVPVRGKTTRDVGRVVTDTGGAGIQFHSVREYRHGDPMKRIDWTRAARGEDLATLQFDVERSTTVVLLIDARREAFVAADRDAPGAVERSLGAAAEVFVGLLDGDDRVGLASIGPGDCWLAPGAGEGHWALARDRLTDPALFAKPDPDANFYAPLAMRRLRKRLPADAQLLLFSPLPDYESVAMARRLHAYGYATTVVSPDTTGTESPGRTVAHVERQLRLSGLREADVRVVDWGAGEPLAAAVDRANRRWSR